MGILFFLIFAAIWYLPLLLKHRKLVREPAKYYLFAFLFGFAAAILAVAVQFGYGAFMAFVLKVDSTKLPTVTRTLTGIVKIFVIIACAEELLKYLGGNLAVKHVPNLSEAGCMLIFGMTGLGFEFFESFTNLGDLFTAIERGITDIHIFMQMWMGLYLWRAWEARKQNDAAGRKKNLRIALLVPIGVHFAFDWLVFEGTSLMDKGYDVAAVILVGISFVIAIVFMIVGLRMAHKVLNAEKAAVETVQTEA